MEQVVITVELHESIMKCRQELMFVVADPKEKSCHGIYIDAEPESDSDSEFSLNHTQDECILYISTQTNNTVSMDKNLRRHITVPTNLSDSNIWILYLG